MLLGLLAFLVLGALATFSLMSKSQQPAPAAVAAIRTAKVFTGPLEVTLRLSGPTSARQFANITAPILMGPEMRGSLVLLELAKSGSFIRKGQLLAKLDGQSLQDHIDDLEDTVAAATNDVFKREAEQKVEWENMQQTLRVANAQFDKARLDHSAGEVRTDVERELLKLAMDEAGARYQQQQRDIAFRRASQDAELKILRLTLERHTRHINRHKRDILRFTITSPMDGLVVMNNVFRGGEMSQIQQGDLVSPGQPIMKIVNPRTMQVEATVSQADSNDLRLGQHVRVGLDAFPDLKFGGKIYSIGALAVGGWRVNYYIRNVPVKILIDGSDPRLIPDLSGHCDVIVDTVPNQLQVHAGAVRTERGKTVAYVKSGENWVERDVTIGKRSSTTVAILAGLTAGEEVRLN